MKTKEIIITAVMVLVMSAVVGLTTYSGYVYNNATVYTVEQAFSDDPRTPIDYMVWAFSPGPKVFEKEFIPVSEARPRRDCVPISEAK